MDHGHSGRGSGSRLIASELDLDVNASGELQAHQSLDRLVGRLQNVDQTLMGAGLKLLTAVLVLMNSAQDGDDFLDRKSTRLNSSHIEESRMPSSA